MATMKEFYGNCMRSDLEYIKTEARARNDLFFSGVTGRSLI